MDKKDKVKKSKVNFNISLKNMRKKYLVEMAKYAPDLAQKISDKMGFNLDFSDIPRPDIDMRQIFLRSGRKWKTIAPPANDEEREWLK
jgi:hypothetical protein